MREVNIIDNIFCGNVFKFVLKIPLVLLILLAILFIYVCYFIYIYIFASICNKGISTFF